MNSTTELETDECFAANPIILSNNSYQFPVSSDRRGFIRIFGKLPKDLVCEHCVLRWHYRAGNNWGYCPGEKEGRLGCGPQETFRGCADIAIE